MADASKQIVIVAIGVRPESGLAQAAGLELGEQGGIRADETMRTSDPHMWAVGDAVEVTDVVTGVQGFTPLADPATNKRGPRFPAALSVGLIR